jgi:N6-L-threonylcarbamoyladenine synthase
MDAAAEYNCSKVALAGGVAANSALRRAMEEACRKSGRTFCCPPPVLCTDNAAMIACAGYYDYIRGVRSGLDLNAMPNLPLGKA